MTTATQPWQGYAPSADELAGRVILITGATAGIGRGVARALAAHGATVLLHGRNATLLEGLYQEIKQVGPEPAVAQLDFERAQGPEYEALTSEIQARYGRLDGLLHNAAILGDRTPIANYDIALWQRVLHVNLTAPFVLTRCLLPLLRESADASVLFTSSGVGNVGRAYWGAYSVSKFGVEGFAQVLGDELEKTQVRVNCLDPGRVRTRMRARAYPAENPATLSPPEAIVVPYLFLLGPASRGITRGRFEAQAGAARST